ncbi:MAG: thiamine-phosphate kinase, partial [Nitrososphaeraceae archaeon]
MNNIIAFTNDMLVESTDVPSGMKPWQISRKSIVSSVSDMAAKGIRSPYYCLISLGVPNNWSKQKITNLIDGFEKSSKEFNIIFLGGDTNESKELIIDCILIGFSNNICKIPQRNNASPGDVVVTSGKFGYTAAGLKILLNKIKSNSNHFRKKAISKVLTPSPNQKFGMILSDLFSSSIDSSDGLGASLYTIAKQSKIDVLIDSLPVSNDLCSFVSENNIDLLELIFNGGEEYEIVATIPQNLLDTARSRAKKNNIDFLEIGKIISGEGNVFVRETNILGNQKVTSNKYPDYFLLNYMGYSHFSH